MSYGLKYHTTLTKINEFRECLTFINIEVF